MRAAMRAFVLASQTSLASCSGCPTHLGEPVTAISVEGTVVEWQMRNDAKHAIWAYLLLERGIDPLPNDTAWVTFTTSPTSSVPRIILEKTDIGTSTQERVGPEASRVLALRLGPGQVRSGKIDLSEYPLGQAFPRSTHGRIFSGKPHPLDPPAIVPAGNEIQMVIGWVPEVDPDMGWPEPYVDGARIVNPDSAGGQRFSHSNVSILPSHWPVATE